MIDASDNGQRYEVRGGSKYGCPNQKVLGYTDDVNSMTAEGDKLRKDYEVSHIWCIDRGFWPVAYDPDNHPVPEPNSL